MKDGGGLLMVKIVKDTIKYCFECMRKEEVIGDGGIKERKCILGGRGLFIGYREVRRVGYEEGDMKRVNIGFYRRVW